VKQGEEQERTAETKVPSVGQAGRGRRTGWKRCAAGHLGEVRTADRMSAARRGCFQHPAGRSFRHHAFTVAGDAEGRRGIRAGESNHSSVPIPLALKLRIPLPPFLCLQRWSVTRPTEAEFVAFQELARWVSTLQGATPTGHAEAWTPNRDQSFHGAMRAHAPEKTKGARRDAEEFGQGNSNLSSVPIPLSLKLRIPLPQFLCLQRWSVTRPAEAGLADFQELARWVSTLQGATPTGHAEAWTPNRDQSFHGAMRAHAPEKTKGERRGAEEFGQGNPNLSSVPIPLSLKLRIPLLQFLCLCLDYGTSTAR
jgi:hypothetical protein